ncbi:protein phosphatase 2C domain-containing protein [Streptomyces sp. B1866]|uniref:PP2C family protein-serine/threonine phosphatase n=1 Tax=Streptomyces sp. B1866 TaxID=3075431 RepID=UPI0028913C9E|nr:protein phosphatase 2C domain-containing protein [Streptomyces sp. B1866]MDT3397926.1 protein phosphatase 2C domain-containing protein [Streptomyces sp. B1866]
MAQTPQTPQRQARQTGCPMCEEPLESGDAFCDACGADVARASARAGADADAAQAPPAGAGPGGAATGGAAAVGAAPGGAAPGGGALAGAARVGGALAGSDPGPDPGPAEAAPAGGSPAGTGAVGPSPTGTGPVGGSPAGAVPGVGSAAGANAVGARPAGAGPGAGSSAGTASAEAVGAGTASGEAVGAGLPQARQTPPADPRVPAPGAASAGSAVPDPGPAPDGVPGPGPAPAAGPAAGPTAGSGVAPVAGPATGPAADTGTGPGARPGAGAGTGAAAGASAGAGPGAGGGARRCAACRTGAVDRDGTCGHCGYAQVRVRDHLEAQAHGVAAATDRGLRHHRNEDAFAVACGALPDGSPAAVAVVCDGVSSATRPDDASAAAAGAARAALLAALGEGTHLQRAMSEAILSAGEAVNALAYEPRAGTGRGTRTGDGDADDAGETYRRHENAPACTIVSAVVTPDAFTVGWIGDSRAYWVPDDRTSPPARLTEDDSWAAQMVASGLMSPEEAYSDARAHAITGWLGADAYELSPHTASFRPDRPGVVVVCTDGLWNYTETAEEVAAAVPGDARTRPMAAARTLVALAVYAGGHDNVTVAVLPFPARSEGAVSA